MMEEQGASPSGTSFSDDGINITGSSFQQENEGLANETGASVTMDMSMITSMTDITLDQALVKMREIDRENLLLKEHLADNNRQIKRQFEVLRSLNVKDKEKVDKFKALISSLREEVKELQIKLMAQEDKQKESIKKQASLENENAHLQRQKTVSEQKVINIIKHAEVQGVNGLDDMDNLPDLSDAVCVTSEDKEKEIQSLEADLTAKGEVITDLRNQMLTVSHQRDQYKMANEIILKDMEGLQKQKEHMDSERRQMYEQNTQLNKELDTLMQSNIASTKKEIEGHQRKAGDEKTPIALDASGFLDDAENLEEMFDQKLTLQQHQEDMDKLKANLDTERVDKMEMEEQLKAVSAELGELQTQYRLAQEKMEMLEREKVQMSKEYEGNLESITHQRQENKTQQAKLSEDQSVLRSQVISLLSEVDELQNRLSAASMALSQKDRRIGELSGANSEWKDRFEEQWHQHSTVIRTLQTQLSQQESMTHQHMEEHTGTKQQYQSLQDNFNRLVTDYQDMLQTLEVEHSKGQQKEASKEMMEEMNKMAAQVIAAEEAINYRDKQLENFKRKCNDLDETSKVLHIQLDTYKTDFQTERESRTKMAQEKSVMEEELKAAQEQVRVFTEQHNQRQMEDIQRRVNQSQRLPSYTEAQRLYDYQQQHNQGPNPPVHQQPQQQQQQQHQMEVGGMSYPYHNNHNHNNNNNQANNYRPQPQHNQAGFSGYAAHGYGQPQPPMNTAGNPAPFDDMAADQFPSMVHECPTCGLVLPDTDSLQLHVADCLDRLQ